MFWTVIFGLLDIIQVEDSVTFVNADTLNNPLIIGLDFEAL